MQKNEATVPRSAKSLSPASPGVTRIFLLIVAVAALAGLHPAMAQEKEVNATPAASTGPDYSVVPRKPELTYYPCMQCHEFMTPNPQVRELFSPHPSTLEHGDQRFWCLTCHQGDDRNFLTSLKGENIEFDDAAEQCAGCHMQRHKDWKFGAHGKRLANWSGERVIYSCPQCHDPHDPAIKARAPQPLPPVRKGLARAEPHEKEHEPAWKRPGKDQHE